MADPRYDEVRDYYNSVYLTYDNAGEEYIILYVKLIG